MPEPRPVVSPIQSRRVGEPHQRVGDLERSAVCDELSAQFAAGRLVPEELEERLTRAVEARTRSDLGMLLSDLPSLEPGPSAPLPVPRVPTPPPVIPVTPAWTALDVLAVLAMIGSFALAAIGLFGVVVSESANYGWIAFLSATVAAVGAASATHLVHRGVARYENRLKTALAAPPPPR